MILRGFKPLELPASPALLSSQIREQLLKLYSRERAYITEYFTLLASLEYNVQEVHKVQQLANDLVDIAVTVPDVPEEII